ncbi:phosphate/phosphite/phosphonate ABC transporter substrate-binding protein [Magnetovibrio sp.]|uniref:phosphate/phosphite/phosphonate ABC transporter substrate-binding protein n=1 Tax=Magnetovibrio sp. TaxID=2024836 RepID=UPI002F922F6C
MIIKRLCLYISVLLVAMATQAHAASLTDTRPLTLGFMPYLNAELLIEKYTPLATYLSEKLEREVHVTVAKNYAEHIRLAGEDKIDIAFLGGSTYVTIGEKYGLKPLLARYEFEGTPTFRSVIFVDKNSPYKNLTDLVGKRVAFGNANSTLSTQVPVYMLLQAGVGLGDLGQYRHLRNHSNVILGVEFGDFDAGAVAEEVFRENADKNIRPLAYSPDLSTHVFATRSTMNPELRKKIATALLDLQQTPRGLAILKNIGETLTGFVPVSDRDYDLHRDILRQVIPLLEP